MKNRTMVVIVSCLVLAFTVYLMSYSGIIDNANQKTEKESLITQLHKNKTVEGSFVDSDGRNIFSPKEPFDKNTEVPVAYSYVLGYNSIIYGTSGMRNIYEKFLYEDKGTGKGGIIQLTTKNTLQNVAYKELQSKNLSGSIVVLENRTGRILACVSRKNIDYEVSNIDEYYEKYNEINGFFLPSATMDQDPPGSIFKIITTAAAIETQNGDYEYTDTGEYIVDDAQIHNYGNYAYGTETLSSAYKHSTNTYFSALAVEKIGENAARNIAERFCIGEQIELDFAMLSSKIEYDGTDKMLAFTSFGQGKLQMSPLHIAMIGQAISNNGEMLKPYIISKMTGAKGKTTYIGKGEKISKAMDKKTAEKVYDIAKETAKEKYPSLYKYNVGCKTGTAQLGNGYNHSYFLCFNDDYTALISINDTTESGGTFSGSMEKIFNEIYSNE